jgi:zinc transport system permease protein
MNFFRDMAVNGFLVTGLWAGLLASIACGVVGPYVITRRIVFLAGAIAHIAIGGVGAAIYLRHMAPDMFGWLEPIYGAAVVAVLAAILLALVHQHVAERMDTLIGAMWAGGMAVGLMLVKFTPDYQSELMGFLFGNIATVAWSDVWLMVALNIAICLTAWLFHRRILSVCLDPEQAQLQGVDQLRTNMVLLVMVALTVICLISVVGLILVIALLTLPAATAGHHLKRLAPMMLVSTILCMALTTVPRVGVYGTAISPEAAIVLAAGAVYLGSVAWVRLKQKT